MADNPYIYSIYAKEDFPKIDNILLGLYKKGIASKSLEDATSVGPEKLIAESKLVLLVISENLYGDEVALKQLSLAEKADSHIVPYFLENADNLSLPLTLWRQIDGSASIPAYTYSAEKDILERAFSEISPFLENTAKSGKRAGRFFFLGALAIICFTIIAVRFFKPKNEDLTLDVKRIQDSVVSVYTVDESGELFMNTGFFVNSHGYLLTCISPLDTDEALIKFPDGSIVDAELVDKDTKQGIALYLVEVEGCQYLPLELSEFSVGDEIFAAGYPDSVSYTLTNGIVSNTKHIDEEDNTAYFFFTAASSEYSFGGPVITKEGKVIGMVSKKYQEAENVNLAKRSYYLKKLLDANKVSYSKR